MNYKIEQMDISHYQELSELWQSTENVGLSASDSQEGIAAFLARNPGLSFVATIESEIVGSILAGHDGRRGYLYHLAVERAHRNRKIGRQLVECALEQLRLAGIQKCHLMIFRQNETGKTVWRKMGWDLRHDIDIMSKQLNSR